MQKFALLLLAALSTSVFARHTSHQTWGQVQGNAAHTGYSNTTIDPAMVKKLWVKDFPVAGRESSLLSRVVVTDDAVYLNNRLWGGPGKDVKQLMALAPENGEIRWKVTIPTQSTSPTFYNNKLYTVAITDKNRLAQNIALNVYDTQTGKLLLSAPATMPSDNIGSPVIDNNQVFIGSHYSQLAMNADTGAIIWKVGNIAGEDDSATLTSKYILRPLHNALSIMDRNDGHLINTIEGTPYDFFSNPVNPIVWDENQHTAFSVFSTTKPEGAQISAIDTELGLVKWSIFIPEHYIKSPVFANNMIYFISTTGWGRTDSAIYSVNAINGKIEWTFKLDDDFFNTNLIVTNNALIYHTPGKVVMLSLQNHEPLATVSTPGCGLMALANDVLYVADDNCMGPPFDYPAYLTAINLN